MLRLWVEWDLGQDDIVFTSEVVAKSWLQEAILCDETLSQEFASAEEVFEAGLAGFIKLRIC